MTRASWLTVGMLLGMFLFGGICGAGVMRAVVDHETTQMMRATPAEARRSFRLRAMARQLGLTAEQRAKAVEILRKYRAECGQVERKVAEQRGECRRKAHEEIRELLTPEQRREHDRILRKHQRRERRRFRGGRP